MQVTDLNLYTFKYYSNNFISMERKYVGTFMR
jgi:hypothetical protein